MWILDKVVAGGVLSGRGVFVSVGQTVSGASNSEFDVDAGTDPPDVHRTWNGSPSGSESEAPATGLTRTLMRRRASSTVIWKAPIRLEHIHAVRSLTYPLGSGRGPAIPARPLALSPV